MRRQNGQRVRCLGPGKEHWFYSWDPRLNRICPKCSSNISKMRLSRMFERVVKDNDNNGNRG